MSEYTCDVCCSFGTCRCSGNEYDIIPEGFWKMRDGNLVAIKMMSDSHLTNSILMLERNDLVNSDEYKQLIKEIKKRSETTGAKE